MSRIRSRDTRPEILVRSLLHRAGFRFRLHGQDLPGKPDVVLRKYKSVVFVHGCFWHRHAGCKRATIPKTRHDFWQKKFDANVRRDIQHRAALTSMGWTVHVVWECDLKSDVSNTLKQLIHQIVSNN